MASESEREIRDAVTAYVKAALPKYRIVHELVCGSNRADLAAIGKSRLLLFEIKSERDTLARCDKQLQAFDGCGHGTILVAHRRWFDETPYANGAARLVWPHAYRASEVWCFPEPPADLCYGMHRWRLPRMAMIQPHAHAFLSLLWSAELKAECAKHRISTGSRATRDSMITDMAWLMTGREIAEAVCRQLRARPFPEADPAISEAA